MKYRPPEVEEGQETDDVTSTSKRKRDLEDTPTVTEQSTDEAETQPPYKAAKAAKASASRNEDDEQSITFEDEGEFDNGVIDEDLSEEGDDEHEDEDEDKPQKGKQDKKDTSKSRGSPIKEKLRKTIAKYGRGPLEGTAIEEKALTGSADAILAMLIKAMLQSKPISHDLTDRVIHKLIDVGYHDIQKLGNASWEEKAMVLKDAGYNRYREQGSTNLGALVNLVNEKYDGDLNNLVKEADYDPQRTRELVKEVKGLGDLGVELFFNNVQSVWPTISPFIDSRSMQTAKDAGFGTDLDAIYADLEQDSVRMCKLANALSAARLEKRVRDLVAI
ncbi:hypothetical protein BJX99DRAFT_238490 [Aspergillus californicus]